MIGVVQASPWVNCKCSWNARRVGDGGRSVLRIFRNQESGFHLIGGTISAMKFYALEYQEIGLDQNTQPEIQFGSKPSSRSRYATREMAAADCVRLNKVQVRFGSHCCAFAVDQLPEGDYAIICACHPRLQDAV
jgi:hypothetical protein